MKKLKNAKLIKYFLILINILLLLLIIKEIKFINFFCTVFDLIIPVFVGFTIAWLIKPIMLKFNKYFNTLISSVITYLIIGSVIIILGYISIPVIISEIKNLIPSIIALYEGISPEIMEKINLNDIINKIIAFINSCSVNIKNIILNLFYSLFISFFFLIRHLETSLFLRKYIPGDLINEISINLRGFVKSVLIDTAILFIMTGFALSLAKMPYTLLFSIIISITNIIPFIGPYIGGIPAVLVALSIDSHTGLIVLIIVVLLQFIESIFIQPTIMGKTLKLNPIIIIIGLILFGYFFGIFGMLISTPLISILKTLYLYSKDKKWFKLTLDK